MPSVSTQTTTFMPKCVPVLQKKQISKKFLSGMKRIHAAVGKQVELSRREIAKEKRNYLKIVKSSITAFNKRKAVALKIDKEVAKILKEQEKAVKVVDKEQDEAAKELKMQEKIDKEAAKIIKDMEKADKDLAKAVKEQEKIDKEAAKIIQEMEKADKIAAKEAANKAAEEERQPEEIAVEVKKAKKTKKSKEIVIAE